MTGDHVYVRRRRGYTHHGIDCGDGTVIHYSGEPGRPGAIRQSALREFLAGGRLQTRHYRHRHSPTKTLRLARSRLGEQSYSLVFNNCEHFAAWCVTGTPRSVQVEAVGDAPGMGRRSLACPHPREGPRSPAATTRPQPPTRRNQHQGELSMALPLLLIPVLIGMAGSGAGCGAAGGLRLKQARAVVRIAEDAQADAVAQYMREVDRTREELAAYGQLKIELNQSGLQRHRDYITASGRSVDPVILADLEESAATLPDVDDPETLRLAESLIGAAVGSVVSGWALRSGLLAAVGAFGSASTGTPIAALTGAAANSATMAAIGGGSLAAGGGGVALGASLLGGVTVAPSLLVTGLTLLIRGEQSVTAADRFRAQVDAHVEALAELLLAQPAIRRRAGELFDAAAHLDSLLDQVMDQLDPQPLDDPSTLPLFQRALLLGSTLAQILTIPVVSSDRHVNSDTADYVGRTSNQEAA